MLHSMIADMLSIARAADLLDRFALQHVVVAGDMVADEYIYGTPVRISREAPVLVLEFSRRTLVPGGATNVAVNLRALGASVSVIGAIGPDAVGRELRQVLEARGIDTAGLVVDPDRATSTKTRIMGGGAQVVAQQMVRIDRVVSTPLHGAAKACLLDATAQALESATALIVSDYEHGVIDPELIDACLPEAERRDLVTTVDAHGGLYRFKGVSLATPNQPEAEGMLGRPLPDLEALRQGAEELLAGMQARNLLITRGSLGMVAIDRDGHFAELPAYNRAEVLDTTGAGDTVAATATLALAAGATLVEAAQLGSIAAGMVVRRLGAATVSRDDLLATFGH
jgi:D-glycero-beta-D-manno-heptose-7-phosphate kinase